MARIASGDRGALAALYRATSPKLFGICLRILHDASEAEEVLQELYLSVWRNAGRFDPQRGRPMGWLVTLARNASIDRLRSARVLRSATSVDDAVEIADPGPTPLEGTLLLDDNRRLEACLGGLDALARDSLRRTFFDGLTYEDLARARNSPLGTVKSQIRRALIKLKACLER